MKFWSKYQTFHSGKRLWKYCLRNGDHFVQSRWVDSFWLSDAIWRHGSWSTMVQVMACCLTAPSHNLDHCWLGNIGFHPRPDAQENRLINLPKFAFENHFCEQFLTLARGQWVNVRSAVMTCAKHCPIRWFRHTTRFTKFALWAHKPDRRRT